MVLVYLTGIGRFICSSLGLQERVLFSSISAPNNAQLVQRTEKQKEHNYYF